VQWGLGRALYVLHFIQTCGNMLKIYDLASEVSLLVLMLVCLKAGFCLHEGEGARLLWLIPCQLSNAGQLFTMTTIVVDLMIKELLLARAQNKEAVIQHQKLFIYACNYTFPHKVAPSAQFLAIGHGVMCNSVVQD